MPNPTENTWRFPRAFWVGNVIELFERAAYYGVFSALAVYLTSVVGFTDIQAGWVGASYAGLIYLLFGVDIFKILVTLNAMRLLAWTPRGGTPTTLVLVVNWFQELRQEAPLPSR
jgi:hypothetical protein